MTEPRSWLFVPADSERKIAKALDSNADAIIFDLEDSVAPSAKASARDILKGLPERSGGPQWWVRVNPIGSEFHKDDIEVIGSADVHGLVLPKAESGADITQLAHLTGNVPIHAIVTETAASLFGLLSYRDPKSPLVAMSWGAEDLSAALGAASKYDADGSSASPIASPARCALPVPSPQACSRSMASSPTSATTTAFAPKPRLRGARALPANSPSTRPRSTSSTPPSRPRTTRSAMPPPSSPRSRHSPTRVCFRSTAGWSTGRT